MTTAAHFDEFMRVVEAASPPLPAAAFGLGWIVRAKAGRLRGVVLDVDASFRGNPDALGALRGRPGYEFDQPWYDMAAQGPNGEPLTLYMPERQLEYDQSGEPIQHPQIGVYFNAFKGDRYAYVAVFQA